MYRLICVVFFIGMVVMKAGATEGCAIHIQIDGLESDSMWFADMDGRRLEILFGTGKREDGSFLLEVSQPLPAGFYALVFKDNRGNTRYLNCWLVDGERSFSLGTDLDDLFGKATVTSSPENAVLMEYLKEYDRNMMDLQQVTRKWKDVQDEMTFREMVIAQEEFRVLQESFIQKYPSSKTARLIGETLFVTPPARTFDNWEEEAAYRHQWFRQHFFDRMDFSTGNFLEFPMWVERTDYYYTVLPPPYPDSMIVMIEDVLTLLKADSQAVAYWFPTVLQTLEIIGLYQTDEVFLHFFKKYIEEGQADFLSESRTERFRKTAGRLQRMRQGAVIPNLTFQNRAGDDKSVHEVEAPFTMLIFWKHNCGYCKKEVPVLKRLYEEKWKEAGLEVISVCGQSGSGEAPKCWKFADDLYLPADWHIVSDYYKRTAFQGVYNIPSFPYLILLDSEKRILEKIRGYVPEGYLERVLNAHILGSQTNLPD